ncbi:hypothetical protein TWF481_005514 [Arthrobotrys musiformis]|uniref:F-box domain-containing protein n=1 Tax=Arthrobotrys musiformis TaxID=47236 RepID=A0AAV9WE17_9PEZI
MSAAKSVLGTYELLEQILSHLPALELLTTIRCVSKSWRSILDTSLTLRWATWRHPGLENPFSDLNKSQQTQIPSDANVNPASGIKLNEEDIKDLGRMQRHLNRGYQINPIAPFIIRKFWKTIFTTVSNLTENGSTSDEDVDAEEVANAVAEAFIRSIEPLGMQLTRPVFSSTSLWLSFFEDFESNVDPMKVRPGPRQIALSVDDVERSKIMDENSELSGILRFLYTDGLISKGWNLIRRVKMRVDAIKNGSFDPKLAGNSPTLLLNILSVEGTHLSTRSSELLSRNRFVDWWLQLHFRFLEPWGIEVSNRESHIQPRGSERELVAL